MSALLKVKICGMRDPANIAEIAKLAPEYMGFIFVESSPRYLAADQAARACAACPRPIVRTGVFQDAPVGSVIECARELGLQAVQLHGHESVNYCAHVADSGPVSVIKAFAIDEQFSFERIAQYESSCELFLFDAGSGGRSGGTGAAFDWTALERYHGRVPFLLAGGMGPGTVAEARRRVSSPKLFGIDLNSKIESTPGMKSAELAARALSEARL